MLRRTNIIRLTALVFLAILFLSILEVGSFLLSKTLARYGVFYDPQPVEGYEEYLAQNDRRLGWVPSEDGVEVDEAGSRTIKNFPDWSDACVSVYGNSFTWGSEVSAEESWPSLLSDTLTCRVNNFGVPGYGTDQALLRFEGNKDVDKAPIVILVHVSENIMRNVNQYRHLLYPGANFQFKPRFKIHDDQLELIPIPKIASSEIEKAFEKPNSFFQDEYFLPEGDSGNQYIKFPFLFGLISAINHFHIRSKILGIPWYTEFYQRDHASNALELTKLIFERFVRSATEMGKKPIVVIMPTGLDLEFFQEHGTWPFQPFLEWLKQSDITFINLSRKIAVSLKGENPCHLFRSCNAHYNAEGNKVVAKAFFEFLHGTHIE